MSENFELEQGRNRALVVYATGTEEKPISSYILNELAFLALGSMGIDADEASNAFIVEFNPPQTSFRACLDYNGQRRSLLVGGQFTDVCVGVYFYNQPPAPEPPEPGPDDDPEPEPEPAPSVTSVVCEHIKNAIGGVYGASAFVVPDTITEFTLEIE